MRILKCITDPSVDKELAYGFDQKVTESSLNPFPAHHDFSVPTSGSLYMWHHAFLK